VGRIIERACVDRDRLEGMFKIGIDETN